MKYWLSTHRKNTLEVEKFEHDGRIVVIVSCSRFAKSGRLYGYIVRVIDNAGYKKITFKHYQYREVAVLSALIGYKMGW